MPDCCTTALDAEVARLFPSGQSGEDRLFERRLYDTAETLSPLTKGFFEAFDVRVIRESSIRTAASTLNVTCVAGHTRQLIFISRHLCEFVWQASMISSRFWKYGGQALVATMPHHEWPTAQAVNAMQQALDMYFGNRPLEVHGESDIDELLRTVDASSLQHYHRTANMALLFIVLHELNHISPYPHHNPTIEPPEEADGASEKRRRRWMDEIRMDALATYLLTLSAFTFHESQGLNEPEAKFMGCFQAFCGADVALHALWALERFRFGAAGVERWVVDPAWASHPPSALRRKIWSFYSLMLGKQILGAGGLEPLKRSMWAMIQVRQGLFRKVLGDEEYGA